MTKEQNDKLRDALEKLYESAEWRNVHELVMELSESEENTKKGYLNILPDVERTIDHLAQTCGWIFDSINGIPKRGKSKTEKIRKVLGYTYP